MVYGVLFMSAPAEVRAVSRPPNTVVEDSGRDTSRRYSVRERAGSKYVPGGNPQPHNGRVIGHIDPVRLVFIPVDDKKADRTPEHLSFGSSALAYSVSDDVYLDLVSIYEIGVAFTAMATAMIRVTRPSVTSCRMAKAYRESFVSRYFPGVALSKNTICSFYEKLGMDGEKRRAFFKKRLEAVMAEHHVVIDGTLKQDNSEVNTLSAFSRKARIRGCREISIIYAYDIELKEPVCSQVFPGNCIDASAYSKFIRDNDIRRGIIVADKGFPPSMISRELEERPDLHFLTPIRRNDVRIRNNNMLAYDGTTISVGVLVFYKKVRIRGGRYLYSFKDPDKAGEEERAWAAKANSKEDFDQQAYLKKKDLFGVVVFESDQDLTPEDAYACYKDRWLLEQVFDLYKNDICLDKTNVQSNFAVIGSEFINFIAMLITCRIISKALKAGVLDKLTYSNMMEDLGGIDRKVSAPDTKPASDDEYWDNCPTRKDFELLEALELSTPERKPEPRKRGRPRKNPAPPENQPKRPRGRPRKNPLPPPDAPKRPRGRPRKNPVQQEEAPPKKRGRPRKVPSTDSV